MGHPVEACFSLIYLRIFIFSRCVPDPPDPAPTRFYLPSQKAILTMITLSDGARNIERRSRPRRKLSDWV